MKNIFATVVAAVIVSSASTALAADPVCGDVNESSSISATDALLVLRKSVAQPVDLLCSAYDDQFSTCQTSLGSCNTSLLDKNAALAACLSAPVCGNGTVEDGEDCEVDSLSSETCVTQGFAGGALACTPGCIFDTQGYYATRFVTSGETIVDHKTGLEWEKKTTQVASGKNYDDPHDVDNTYAWSSTGAAPDGDAFTDFLATLNDGTSEGGAVTTGCYAGHCDWRLPTVEELLAIGGAGPAFQPDASADYWSATNYASNPSLAWTVGTDEAASHTVTKTGDGVFVRAVRSRF